MANRLPPEAMDILAREMLRMSDRGLGDLQLRSNLAWSDEAAVTSRAARNLIAKARKALADDDREKADRYVDRALQLPYDERAEADAALQAAHMLVFSTVTDAVEASVPGDSRWLDAAEAALDRCGSDAREDLLETLRIVAKDYEVDPAEKRRIRRIAPGDGLVQGTGDVMAARDGADKPTVRRIVVEVLEAVVALQNELTARNAPTGTE